MMKKILFTGGSGLLALNWAAAIRNRYSVTMGLHERSVELSGVEAQKIDLESADAVARTLESGEFNLVIHTAGFTSIEGCERSPDRARHDNVILARNVARACASAGKALVHISTDHLFSGNEQLVSENHPIAPQNVYGRTKAEAEYQVLESNPRALVIRTNFYGWGTNYRKSFSDGILDALRSGTEISLFSDVFYTPILIEMLAEAVLELVGMETPGIFHVVCDERLSKYEFGLKLADAFGLNRMLVRPGLFASRKALVKRPHDMSLSNDKVCKLLGRVLDGVDAHIARLRQQELDGLALELIRL